MTAARGIGDIGQAALIHNPHSSRNRRKPLGAFPAGLLSAQPQTLDELRATLAGFAQREVGLVIVSGGDGTVRDVLSALPGAYGSQPLPAISILARGNANVIAADVGTAGDGSDGLARLLAHLRSGSLRERLRPLLSVSWPDLDRTPVQGFVMGAAAVSRATRYAHEKVLARGVSHGASVAMTVAGAFSRTLRRGEGWFDGEPIEISIDGGAARAGNRFAFMATTLDKLMLGLWPFWGSGGPLRYVDIDAPPARLGRSILPLLRGKPTAYMLANGYRSGGAHAVQLRLPEPIIIDGEAFSPGASGIVDLRAGSAMRFLSP